MEFSFNLDGILPGRITVLDNRDSFSNLRIYDLSLRSDNNREGSGSWTYTQSSNTPWDIKVKKRRENLEVVLDKIGIASAKAQDLHSPITTFKKLVSSSQQKIYTIRDVNEPRLITGMLKVGIKRLFVCDDVGAYHEVDPLCVLDFYIHESKQRCGFGHELFDAMLKAEGLDPAKLAIDRPSFKCLAFLEKHYDLKQPIRQNNNFVIYPGFLTDRPGLEKQGSNSSKQKFVSLSSKKSKSLDCISVPVSPKEIKSKTFRPSMGSFLNLNDTEGNTETNYRKQKQNMTGTSYKQAIGNCRNKGEKNWGVNEALHSYSPKIAESHSWCNNPTNCFLNWNDTDSNEETRHRKQKPNLTRNPCTQPIGHCDAGWNRGVKNWGVNEALHSYSSNDVESHGWSNNQTNCELPPISTVSTSPQKELNDQLQSAWNMFGVKPLEYSPLFKK